MKEKKQIIPHVKNKRSIPYVRDKKVVPDKDVADQSIRLGEKAGQNKLLFERPPSGSIFKETDFKILQKKEPLRKKSGSHSLPQLHHFKTHQK